MRIKWKKLARDIVRLPFVVSRVIIGLAMMMLVIAVALVIGFTGLWRPMSWFVSRYIEGEIPEQWDDWPGIRHYLYVMAWFTYPIDQGPWQYFREEEEGEAS